MPTRVLRGEIVKSQSLSRVSLEAELLFRNLIVLVDDYGRFDGDPEIIAAHAYPRRRSVSAEHVAEWLTELATADGDSGPVILYEHDGKPYLVLRNWEKHRGKSRRGKNSRWPQPPDSACQDKPTASAEILGDPRGPADTHGDPPEESGSRGVEESRSRGKAKRDPEAPDGGDSDWILRILKAPRFQRHGSTEAETLLWVEARYDEIEARCRSEAPPDVNSAIKAHAIASWQAYLKTRDPTKREFFRDARVAHLATAKAALDTRDPPVDQPPPDDPLRFLRAGGNPHAAN